MIIVDIQNDYFSGGLWPVDDMENVAARAGQVLAAARQNGEAVFHIYHEAQSDTAPFFLPGTDGARIHQSVAPLAGEAVILKHRPNSFHNTVLHHQLQAAGVNKVTIIGAMTQMCIDATARAAADLGYEVRLVAGACGAKSVSYSGTVVPAHQVQAAFLAPLGMSYATII